MGMTDATRNATHRTLFTDSITVCKCIPYPRMRFRPIHRLTSKTVSNVLAISMTTIAAVFIKLFAINSSPSNLPEKKRSKPPIPIEKNAAHKKTN